jgi:hypothetical protein
MKVSTKQLQSLLCRRLPGRPAPHPLAFFSPEAQAKENHSMFSSFPSTIISQSSIFYAALRGFTRLYGLF